MKIEEYQKLKNNLEYEFGKDELSEITNEVTNILKKHKLDVTPYILQDIFEYIRLSLAITKI